MRLLPLAPALMLLGACSQISSQAGGIDESRFRADIKELSSDRYLGRLPTTQGETLTLAYLERQFRAMGLEPGNGDSYLQPVPMVTYTAEPGARLSLGGESLSLPEQAVLTSFRSAPEQRLSDSQVVFVGYGIDAPEYGWNDYQGLDVTGKTVLILVNDPGFASGDPDHFKGSTMTYYGRWDYKFAEAGRKGAAAALIIHDTEPASYPWSVVANSWTGPQLDLADSRDPHPALEGWVRKEVAEALLAKEGKSLEALMAQAALRPGNLPLSARAEASLKQRVEHATSHNVVAKLTGASRPGEVVSYTAHWDHIGADGDAIYNGALDNATGVAGILEIARQFAAAPKPPARTVQFIAVTGEEQGLLGSRYYVANPTEPLASTVGVFNLDSTNVYGAVREFTVVGLGQSQLDDYLGKAAAGQQRVLASEHHPEAGGFFRSDHFSFVKEGVPAVFAGGGTTPKSDALARYRESMRQEMKGCYHNTCDIYREHWNLSGALEDIEVFYRAGNALANSDHRPGFKRGSEFYSLRPAS
ncbi:M20/M25/M40 family metallo-hydrolase [Ferrimonas sediminicola]|uniref:M20/M25/M40 family metallo-hydrolase n=1 Tax=Ferrimonas sediminicola TaxID=2569538 RepID=A0A4U1BE16_9GAMM|nr:M28 family metallopeptidase [Ferrimonas sediminicola]TKB49038.1 M20/M25/M40 family metallo-hydrolase [Ferrimonas sediminicola]